LIHDAQHTAAELPALSFLGHSAMDYAVGLGHAAGVKRVTLYHHDPLRTDVELDAIVDSFRKFPVPVEAAAEGMELDLCATRDGVR
ncbi:MAG: phytochrome sensor protein, partial [Candidatus Dormibacteria bacterium]